ncbi:MAG TPA: J domain-containing protein [Chroococcidiopsis sp.]
MPEEGTGSSYYAVLGVIPSASPQQIRQAYRERSKLYHPDTTELPEAIATAKFQELNEAYGTLSSPEKRFSYDLRNGFSRVSVIQARPDLDRPKSEGSKYRSSAYLDPSDRPLSGGELFALFILGITFIGCLILVVTIGLTRGEMAIQWFNPLNGAPTEAIADPANLDAADPSLPPGLTPLPATPLAQPDGAPLQSPLQSKDSAGTPSPSSLSS